MTSNYLLYPYPARLCAPCALTDLKNQSNWENNMTHINPIHIVYISSIPLQCIHANVQLLHIFINNFYLIHEGLFYKSSNILQVYLTFKHSSKCIEKHLAYTFFAHFNLKHLRMGWCTIYQVNSKSRVASQRTQQWFLSLTQ